MKAGKCIVIASAIFTVCEYPSSLKRSIKHHIVPWDCFGCASFAPPPKEVYNWALMLSRHKNVDAHSLGSRRLLINNLPRARNWQHDLHHYWIVKRNIKAWVLPHSLSSILWKINELVPQHETIRRLSAPEDFVRAKDVYVYDNKGTEYLDPGEPVISTRMVIRITSTVA